jgi:hypothetical protein
LTRLRNGLAAMPGMSAVSTSVSYVRELRPQSTWDTGHRIVRYTYGAIENKPHRTGASDTDRCSCVHFLTGYTELQCSYPPQIKGTEKGHRAFRYKQYIYGIQATKNFVDIQNSKKSRGTKALYGLHSNRI